MLRNALLFVSVCVAAFGVSLIIAGDRHAWPVAVWGSVLFILILAERWRYQHTHQRGGDDWVATDEKFIDPESGKLTKVYYRSTTGERRYVAVDE